MGKLMGIRVIKTAVAALAAIYTAVYFGLEPPLSAGLLAILGVEVTRMKGLRSAFARFAASVVGLFFASSVFLIFGFQIWVVALFILIAFPIMSRLYLKDGIVTSAVIVFHVFTHGEVTWPLIGNEILLLITGLGYATLLNLVYMPGEESKLKKLKDETERLFVEIFTELAASLRDPSRIWNGAELLQSHRAIEQGIALADMNHENRFWGQEAYWRTYFEMRRQQLEIIEHMLGELAFVYEKLHQGVLLADVFKRLSDDIMSEVYEGNAERELQELERTYQGMPLPESREEFEVRAVLLQLCRELKRFLAIARRLKKKRRVDNAK
jgi:uncharacterized membrane protein YgaE (UPF0421/DUF939 family)